MKKQDSVFIEGFGIAGYRSYGERMQFIGPCSKVNLIIGQNNSGKSNILSFLTDHYKNAVASAKASKDFQLGDLDLHINKLGKVERIGFAVGLIVGGEQYKILLENLAGRAADGANVRQRLERMLMLDALTFGTKVSWLTFKSSSAQNALSLDEEFINRVESCTGVSSAEWGYLWRQLVATGNRSRNGIPEVFQILLKTGFVVPGIHIIPAFRKVGQPGAADSDLSGIGLIDKLARLQNPSHDERAKIKSFEEINRFLKNVIGNESAALEIPYDRDMILVHMNELTLPLKSLGTGVHEVIILAAAATVLRNQVLCIEEPELHLHPLLQRKLLRYLSQKTDNQYFITTHSAHLLDTPGASIFHVRHQDGASVVDPVYNSSERSLVCVDLGYRPSDLLQSNSVIWVEGPSDRIYLNHWIKTVAPDLVEGIHYSIMFYGGRLLSHLSASDPEVTEFISLRRLNRYISILIDSDRSTSGKDLNETKKRVVEEFDQGPGFAWVTSGREIENYIARDVLEAAVRKVHPSAIALAKGGRYGHALHFQTAKGEVQKSNIDKVKVAHEVVNSPANLGVLDLRERIDQVVGFIRGANDFFE